MRTFILRFRDLVTESGGTIADHAAILRSFGEVWWGWWMRANELAPREILAELRSRIHTDSGINGYLFDSGTGQLYLCRVGNIKMSPTVSGIGPPDPERSPEYYHRGRYPAWFLLHSVCAISFDDARLNFESYPTLREPRPVEIELLGKQITKADDLRHSAATLWIVTQML